MSVDELTLNQIFRGYLEDYDINDKFSYTFGVGQILISESKDSIGINKNAVINLFNEYLTDFSSSAKYLYDLGNCHFLVAIQTAIIKNNPDSQKGLDHDFKKSDNPVIVLDSIDPDFLNRGFGENTIIG